MQMEFNYLLLLVHSSKALFNETIDENILYILIEWIFYHTLH